MKITPFIILLILLFVLVLFTLFCKFPMFSMFNQEGFHSLLGTSILSEEVIDQYGENTLYKQQNKENVRTILR